MTAQLSLLDKATLDTIPPIKKSIKSDIGKNIIKMYDQQTFLHKLHLKILEVKTF